MGHDTVAVDLRFTFHVSYESSSALLTVSEWKNRKCESGLDIHLQYKMNVHAIPIMVMSFSAY